jgi:hypothetical protein
MTSNFRLMATFQSPTDVRFATSARCIIACNYGLALHPFGLSGEGEKHRNSAFLNNQ